ncbi:3-oxoacyl-ACP reductase [Corynebacterium aquatimens]|uniref:3-oxoacyl-[acyl-carrier protein] reductase n=1 Tax=Corynebacterium aquatimens TaxID=1190508 RepID=A0A931GW22_9CORY|nr:3-oxoacyl-ACP reductase [Corynebacterium aquatimens]MBG6122011.1 3-oxoacyl-[acyl-carrier protein] reductase [Corynebacterium aquatimens]WJY65450.1 3-oxoacyl-[acyl-carrier-protein] reductase FabG [Corynebacterium aquatimens]
MASQGFLEQLINSPLAAKLGVPQGYPLRRYKQGEPLLQGPVVVGGEGRLGSALAERLDGPYKLLKLEADTKRAGIVFDATGITKPEELGALYEFFNPQLRKVDSNARLVVIGTTPELIDDADERISQRALEGFTRSLAKEMRKGATAQLVYVDPSIDGGAVDKVESTLRFLLSGKSAYVDGQVIRITPADVSLPENWEKPLAGRLAVVTGAARGIGATIAETLARDGAKVICVDIPQAGEGLAETANKVKGTALPLDVTNPKAAEEIAKHAEERYGRKIDTIVHNAGVTRDKLLANMDEGRWNMVQSINLVAPVRITEKLIEADAFAEKPSVIGVSSIAGIAGNRGQTNYATTKAGVVGFVDALADAIAEKGGSINAVAPGFIETDMTAAIPTATREVGRRLNSLSQGGKPVDVAETVAYFAAPSSVAVNGNTVRVCGQGLLGA